VKVIDFGIAWAVDRLVEPTRAAMLKGKPSYMAPEQLRGQPVTRSVDIFAIGVMLHELLAGRHLFRRSDDIATIAAILEGNVPALRSLRPDVPPELDAVVQRTLSADPALRPQTAAELV
jgi:serine/threonine-protein kinase